MEVSRYVTESAAFTRATLLGKPSRWLIFILLGLPWTALSSLLESRRILDNNIIQWDLIPWHEAELLIAAGILCNLLVSGWIVRLLRYRPAPPEFDRPARLCLEGIKAHTIPLVWMLVPSVLAFVQYSIAGGGTVTLDSWPPDPATVAILILFAIELLIIIYAAQYGLIGTIRFARTGSVREAFALPEIRKTAVRIGFLNYYLGLAVVILAWILFSLSLHVVYLVPYAGPFIALCLGPVPIVFCSRFVAHFCDEDQYPMVAGAGGAPAVRAPLPATIREMVVEYIFWLAVLATLVVLCFTPMAIIAASVIRWLP